jgi:hypothetical protein
MWMCMYLCILYSWIKPQQLIVILIKLPLNTILIKIPRIFKELGKLTPNFMWKNRGPRRDKIEGFAVLDSKNYFNAIVIKIGYYFYYL